jgi:hypothetical protein
MTDPEFLAELSAAFFVNKDTPSFAVSIIEAIWK